MSLWQEFKLAFVRETAVWIVRLVVIVALAIPAYYVGKHIWHSAVTTVLRPYHATTGAITDAKDKVKGVAKSATDAVTGAAGATKDATVEGAGKLGDGVKKLGSQASDGWRRYQERKKPEDLPPPQ